MASSKSTIEVTITLARSSSATLLTVISAGVLGRALGVTGYGSFQLVYNLALQVGQLCEAGVGTALVSLEPNQKSFALAKRVGRLFPILMAVPCVILAILALFLLADQFLWRRAFAGSAIAVSIMVQMIAVGLLRLGDKSRTANAVLLMPSIFFVPMLLLAWWFGVLTIDAAISIFAIAFAVTALLSAMWAWHFADFTEVETDGKVTIGELLQRSWKSSLARFSQLLIYRLDLFILAGILGDKSLGIYAPAVLVISQLNHLGDAVGFVLYPGLARKEFGKEQAISACRQLFVVTMASALMLALVSPLIFLLVWGEAFTGAVWPLLFLIPGYLFLTPARVLAAYLAVETQFQANLKASLSGLFANCVLNFLLIPPFGIVGAAIATSCSLILVVVVLSREFASATQLGIHEQWIPRGRDLRLRPTKR